MFLLTFLTNNLSYLSGCWNSNFRHMSSGYHSFKRHHVTWPRFPWTVRSGCHKRHSPKTYASTRSARWTDLFVCFEKGSWIKYISVCFCIERVLGDHVVCLPRVFESLVPRSSLMIGLFANGGKSSRLLPSLQY